MTDAPLMLSVSGLRGLVGRSLTDDVAARFGRAIGQWVVRRRAAVGGDRGGRSGKLHIVLGRDSRPSGEQFERIEQLEDINLAVQNVIPPKMSKAV